MAARKATAETPVDVKGKGKAAAASSPPPLPAAAAPANDLLDLADSITANAASLAPGNGDAALAITARDVVKLSFDRALQSEHLSFPHLSALLKSLTPTNSASGPSTRSNSVSARTAKAAVVLDALVPTPLEGLTIEGMEDEMIWAQMEMRGMVVNRLLEEMFGAGGNGRRGEGNDEDEDDVEAAGEQDGGEIVGEDDDDSSDTDSSESESVDDEGEDDDRDGEYEEGQSDDEDEQDDYSNLDTSSSSAHPFKESPAYFKPLTKSTTNDDSESESEPEDADPNRSLSLASFDDRGSGKKGRKASGPASVVDDAFFSLHDFHVQIDEGEAEMMKALRGEVAQGDDDDDEDEADDIDLFSSNFGEAGDGDDDDEEEDDLDGNNVMYADFFEPPPRPFTKAKPPPKAKKSKSRRPPPVGELAPASDSDDEPIFSASTTAAAGAPTIRRKRSVRFSEAVKVKTIAARGSDFDKLVAKVGWEKATEITDAQEGGFVMDGAASSALAADDVKGKKGKGKKSQDDDDDSMEMDDDSPFGQADDDDDNSGSDEGDEMTFEDEDEMMRSMNEEDGENDSEEDDDDNEEGSDDEDESDDDQEGRETIDRLKSSLFDEDEDDDSGDENATPAAQLSRHERRLLALSSQIAALEAENVGSKNWATKGEAKSKDRPINSLLGEDLEYERSGKVVPIITEETTKTIEELIKRRIIDNQFDDVIRQREIDPNSFLPSRFMELQDSKSNKSLAEIYEDEYTTAKEKEAGRTVVHTLDKDLEKKHAEIEELFEDLSAKLDALSNARFTPKPPKATITTISNVASITLESALPTGTSTSALLAPEEVFVADPTNEDRSDFTPSMKKSARQKRRKARASMAKSVEQFTKGVKGEKERATKELIGTKGVTIIGKGGKIEVAGGKKRKRGADDVGGSSLKSGVDLKL